MSGVEWTGPPACSVQAAEEVTSAEALRVWLRAGVRWRAGVWL